VLALCNLALLTGQVGRHGAGLSPLRGQNNVQGGGDMGALPNKLPGFQDVGDDVARKKFETEWQTTIPAENGWHLTEMFEAMERGDLTSVFVIGENPAQSEADSQHATHLLESLDHLVVLDIYLTKTAQLADVVLPGSASWCESDGTVTNSERRVQRVRKALDPPGDARDDIDILLDLAARLGHNWHYDDHQQIWDELRRLSPLHAGMSWPRLEELGGIQWPCYSEDRLEPSYLHGRLWSDDPGERGRLAPFSVVPDEPPVEALDDEYPLRLTTGRRLDSYNTGVQSGGYRSPNRVGETIDISPEDACRMSVMDGERVAISSRRGTIQAPARIDPALRPGLVFMTMHFPDEVDVNIITIDATDPKAGTAEFKACAVRIDRLHADLPLAAAGD
jgi:predicted molibdopterin-dependent oxidoreductase YjgC